MDELLRSQTGRFSRPVVVFFTLVLIIAGLETLVMSAIPRLMPTASASLQTFVDAFLLAVLSAPAVWLLVVRPLRDAAERKQAEAALQQQQEFSLRLLQDCAVPCFVLAPDHTVIAWNKACEELSGMAASAVLGTGDHWRAFYDHQRPTLADVVIDGVGSELYANASRSPFAADGRQSEGWYANVGGQRRYLFFDAVPVRGADGELIAVIETLEDITARKEQERQLLKGKAELTVKHEQLTILFTQVEAVKREWERTMDCISDVVILLDRDGRVRRCNYAALALVELPYEKVHALAWPQLAQLAGLPDLVLNNGRGEFFHQRLDKWFLLTRYPYGDRQGEAGAVITIQDTTEMRRAALELEQTYAELQETHAQMLQQEKMASIGQLAAGVAHEINNPNGYILSNLGTLRKYMERLTAFVAAQDGVIAALGTPDAEQLLLLRRQQKIDHIITDIPDLISESLEGAERMRKLVRDMKGFSRRDDAECTPTNLAECLDSTINIVWNELKYKATLKKEFAELPALSCHSQQLSQVFMNLLVNAAHAIETQGEITVSTWQKGDSVYVAVADTGSGIPEELRGRIFEPFFTTKEAGKGTGLGLAISYDIVRKHGGDITVESEVGKGTRFTVRLPLGGAAPATA